MKEVFFQDLTRKLQPGSSWWDEKQFVWNLCSDPRAPQSQGCSSLQGWSRRRIHPAPLQGWHSHGNPWVSMTPLLEFPGAGSECHRVTNECWRLQRAVSSFPWPEILTRNLGKKKISFVQQISKIHLNIDWGFQLLIPVFAQAAVYPLSFLFSVPPGCFATPWASFVVLSHCWVSNTSAFPCSPPFPNKELGTLSRHLNNKYTTNKTPSKQQLWSEQDARIAENKTLASNTDPLKAEGVCPGKGKFFLIWGWLSFPSTLKIISKNMNSKTGSI